MTDETIPNESVPYGSESQEDEETTPCAEESRFDRLEKELAAVKKHLKIAAVKKHLKIEPQLDDKKTKEEIDKMEVEKLKEVIFADSTHRLFFMKEVELPDGDSHTVTRYDKLLSLFVIVWQFGSYVAVFELVRHLKHGEIVREQ